MSEFNKWGRAERFMKSKIPNRTAEQNCRGTLHVEYGYPFVAFAHCEIVYSYHEITGTGNPSINCMYGICFRTDLRTRAEYHIQLQRLSHFCSNISVRPQ